MIYRLVWLLVLYSLLIFIIYFCADELTAKLIFGPVYTHYYNLSPLFSHLYFINYSFVILLYKAITYVSQTLLTQNGKRIKINKGVLSKEK